MIDVSNGVLLTGLFFLLVSATLIFVALYRIRAGLPETSEARLRLEVADLKRQVAAQEAELRKMQSAIQTLTDAWTADRIKLTQVIALNHDLEVQLASLTGKAVGPVAVKTLTMLRKALVERLRLDELSVLAADVEVDMEDLGGETQEAKALKLLQYLQDRNRVGSLVYALRRMRPDIQLDVAP